jgi:hypothetical protein
MRHGQEGQTYLGGESYPAPGADSVVLTVGGVSAGQRIVATATDAQGNTSEFSASFVITSALQAPEWPTAELLQRRRWTRRP